MKANTNQSSSFSDVTMEKIESDLDTINELVEWSGISNRLNQVKSDYSPLSLFKVLLLQTWYQLSDAVMSQSLRRDLAFMKFAGFTLAGNKPDSATICRFRNRLTDLKVWDELLTLMNQSLAERGLKVAGGRYVSTIFIISKHKNTGLKVLGGRYVSTDATLIHSARRPRSAEGDRVQLKKRVKTSRNSVKFSSFCPKRATSVKITKKLMKNEVWASVISYL